VDCQYPFHAGFLLGLFFNPEDGNEIFFPERLLNLTGLHGVISQKTQPFKVKRIFDILAFARSGVENRD
jgi:hypothetical protein